MDVYKILLSDLEKYQDNISTTRDLIVFYYWSNGPSTMMMKNKELLSYLDEEKFRDSLTLRVELSFLDIVPFELPTIPCIMIRKNNKITYLVDLNDGEQDFGNQVRDLSESSLTDEEELSDIFRFEEDVFKTVKRYLKAESIDRDGYAELRSRKLAYDMEDSILAKFILKAVIILNLEKLSIFKEFLEIIVDDGKEFIFSLEDIIEELEEENINKDWLNVLQQLVKLEILDKSDVEDWMKEYESTSDTSTLYELSKNFMKK